MDIQKVNREDRVVLTLIGKFAELADCRQLEQSIEGIGDDTRPIVLDMTRVTFLSSQAVGTLVFQAQSGSDAGHALYLLGARKEIREILTIAGLQGVLNMVDSERELDDILSAPKG